MGRFLNGLVIVLILGMGLTSSFVIDDPYSSEKEAETIEDMTAEMNKLDDLNSKHRDKEQVKDVSHNVRSVNLEQEYHNLIDECKLEGHNQIPENEVRYKQEQFHQALRKLYQSLQHGKGSLMEDFSWLVAKRSEVCAACVLRKLCDKAVILNLLGVSNVQDCKRDVLKLAEQFHYQSPSNVSCDFDDPFRTIDGTCNNVANPLGGSAGDEFIRLTANAYGDGVSSLRRAENGGELPNARNVSRFVHGSNADRSNPNSKVLTHLAMNFGQFMDHDFTLAEAQGLNCEPNNPNPECINIEVPFDDAVFQDRGVQFFEVERDAPHKQSVECKLVPREHTNIITACNDASNVYGSTDELAEELRAADGRMKVMKHPHGCPMAKLLPAQPPELFCESKDPNRPCFLAGDERVNENQGLMSVHTIFVREHNRIATWFGQNTAFSAERIYQETRKIIGACLQVITYNEFLPLILSRKTRRQNHLILERGTDYFTGYDPSLDCQMSAAFSTAAYRFGHSLVQEQFSRFTQDGFEHKCDNGEKSEYLPIPVLDFGNPTYLYDKCSGGVDSIFRGLIKDAAGKLDGRFSESVQHNLFRGPGDLSDLVAINIQRGRERGVASYTVYRNEVCNIEPHVNDFDDLEQAGFTQEQIDNLRRVYDSVHDIDLFTGGMLEPTSSHGGLMGDTFQCILAKQFERLRKGDRFWHENAPDENNRTNKTAFTRCQLREVRKCRLAKIICENGDDISAVPRNVLQQSKIFLPCDSLPEIDLNAWRPNFQCSVSSDESADHPAHYADEL